MNESRTKDVDETASYNQNSSVPDSGPEEDYRHFYPELQPGSDHPSDNEWVDPPAYESDEDLELPESDNSLYANINQDRLHRPVEEWCSCGECKPMDTEKEHVCCNESHFITAHRGEHRCISQVGMFKELVVSEDGLVYSRYMYSMNITDPDKRDRFLKKKLNQKELRFMAYRTFINMLSCRDFDRNVRYILPACVVSQIRAKFPNENGEPYTGYVSLKSKDGQSLP